MICEYAELRMSKGEFSESKVCVCTRKNIMIFVDEDTSLEEGAEGLCMDCDEK